MRHILIGGLTVLYLIPAAAHAQPGPALGDPAPPPPPAPAQKSEKKQPGVAEKVGGVVGSVVAKSAIVTTGPVGGIAVGLVGGRVGSGAVSVVKRMVGGDGKDGDDLAAPPTIADPILPEPTPAAEVAAADAAAKASAPEPVKLAPNAGQSIQTAPSEPASSPSPVSNAASPSG